jgi:hypothetical protein
VNTWVRLPRCFGLASSSGDRFCRCCCAGLTDIRLATYFWYSGEPRNRPDQSSAGSSEKAWKTSAQSPAAKYFSPSAGGPK